MSTEAKEEKKSVTIEELEQAKLIASARALNAMALSAAATGLGFIGLVTIIGYNTFSNRNRSTAAAAMAK